MTGEESRPVPENTNWRLRLSGALLNVQSLGFGCGGLVTLLYAVLILAFALTSGLGYLIIAIAAGALAAVLLGLAATLWVCARKLRSRPNPWRRVVLAIEVLLAPIGSALFAVGSQARPTDNPFDEGGDAYVVLFGLVLGVSGGVMLIVLLWELASDLRNKRRS